MNEVLTKPEAADFLRVSVRTVERMIESGDLPVLKVRGRVRLPLAGLREYVEQQTTRQCPISAKVRRTGTPASPSAGVRLDEVLAQKIGAKRKGSKNNGRKKPSLTVIRGKT